MAKHPAKPDPANGEAAPGKAARAREPARREPARTGRTGSEAGLEEVPTRLVVVAYLLAAVCAVAPLAVLGAAFAGAVLFTRGRRGAGAGVIAVAVLCSALGVALLR